MWKGIVNMKYPIFFLLSACTLFAGKDNLQSICIPAELIDEANAYVKANLDREGGEKTFIVNKVDSIGNGYCEITIPRNNSKFSKGMLDYFRAYHGKVIESKGKPVQVKEKPKADKDKVKFTADKSKVAAVEITDIDDGKK
jgi:hypothetical protein